MEMVKKGNYFNVQQNRDVCKAKFFFSKRMRLLDLGV
jgi:hypothetical protein